MTSVRIVGGGMTGILAAFQAHRLRPMPLFKPLGVAMPSAFAKQFATYKFDCKWSGPAPFYVQNFKPRGACWRIFFYPSGGSTLVTAECVAETDRSASITRCRQWSPALMATCG